MTNPDPTSIDASGADPVAALGERLALAERHHQAWKLRQVGASYRQIAAQMDIDVHTAHHYVARHEAAWGYSPDWEPERRRQLAVLADLETNLWREATQDTTTWAAAAPQILKVLQDKRAIMGHRDTVGPQVQVGVTLAEVPGVGRALQVVAGIDADGTPGA